MKQKITAYEQCQNCYCNVFEFLGFLFCNSEGLRKIKSLKKQHHCAAQLQIIFRNDEVKDKTTLITKTMKTQPVRTLYQFDQIPQFRTFAIYSKSGFYTKFNFIVAFNPDFAKFYFEKEHGKYSKILSVSECDFLIK